MKVPQIVGKPEAAAILGIHPNNMKQDGKWGYGLPPSLQDRGLAECATTPLWLRSEVEAAARSRKKP